MGDANQEFEWSLKNGDLDQVKSTLAQDRSLANKALGNGRFPLCVAADYGQGEVIECLISNGAKVNVTDKFGITPLLSAVYEGHPECVKILLQKGASKTGKAPDGSSYIDCAETDDIKDLLK